MTKDSLLKEISGTMIKNKVEKLSAVSVKENLPLTDLINLSFCPQPEIAFRAAWMLEHIAKKYPEFFLPFTGYFLTSYPKQNNSSCRRHYAKIAVFLSAGKVPAYRNILDKHNLELLIETTFDWLTAPGTPVALKVYCMEVLLNLKDSYDWIAEELKAQTEFLLRDGSAAVQSRGKKILKRLQCA